MYHFIHDKSIIKNVRFNSLKIKEFSKQISYLKKKTNIIGLDDLEDITISKKNLNKPSTLLTFDDGYKDHYDIVLPILVKKKIKGIFFPPTDIFEDKILDLNKIHCILGAQYNSEFIIKIITDYLSKKKISIEQLIKKFNINLNSRFDDRQTTILFTNAITLGQHLVVLWHKTTDDTNNFLLENRKENFTVILRCKMIQHLASPCIWLLQ